MVLKSIWLVLGFMVFMLITDVHTAAPYPPNQITITTYLGISCSHPIGRQWAPNTPDTCHPLYAEDGSIKGHIKFGAKCSMEAKFFEFSLYTVTDTTCTGTSTPRVLALSNTGCNRDASGFSASVVCTGGPPSVPVLPYIMLEHHTNTQCTQHNYTAIFRNEPGCHPVHLANSNPGVYVKLDAACSTQSSVHLIRFSSVSSCTATYQLLQAWVNEAISCNTGAAQSYTIRCFGNNSPVTDDYIIMKEYSDECGGTVVRTQTIKQTIGLCLTMLDADGLMRHVVRITQPCLTSHKILHMEHHATSSCDEAPTGKLVTTGADLCNVLPPAKKRDSNTDTTFNDLFSQPKRSIEAEMGGGRYREYYCRSSPSLISSASQDFARLADYPSFGCNESPSLTQLIPRNGSCARLATGSGRLASSCDLSGPGSITLKFYTDYACGAFQQDLQIATGGVDYCNHGTDGALTMQCFGAPDSFFPPPAASIFIERFENDCDQPSTSTISIHLTEACAQAKPIGGVPLLVSLPESCNTEDEFAIIDWHLKFCNESLRNLFALGSDKCNFDGTTATRVRCRNTTAIAAPRPYIYMENRENGCKTLRSTVILENKPGCVAGTVGDAFDVSNPSYYLERSCGALSQHFNVSLFVPGSNCFDHSEPPNSFILQPEKCNVRPIMPTVAPWTVNPRCYGVSGGASEAMVFIRLGDGQCEHWAESWRFHNGPGCHPIYSSRNEIVGYAKMGVGCSSLDSLLQFELYPHPACTGTKKKIVLSTNDGVCNNDRSTSEGWLAECTGISSAPQAWNYMIIRSNREPRTCDRYNYTQTDIVPITPGQCTPVYPGANGTVTSWVKLPAACSPDDHFVRVTEYGSSDCSGAGIQRVYRVNDEHDCNFGYSSGARTIDCYGQGVPKTDYPYIFIKVSDPTGCNQSLLKTTLVIPNVAGQCVSQHFIDPYPGSKPYAKMQHQCSLYDSFHNVILDTDPTCSNSTGGLNYAIFAVNNDYCNADWDYSFKSQCFGPASLIAKDENYVTAAQLDSSCQSEIVTAIFPNMRNSCNPAHTASGRVEAYVKFQETCSENPNTWAFTTYSDSNCEHTLMTARIVPDGRTCPLAMGHSAVMVWCKSGTDPVPPPPGCPGQAPSSEFTCINGAWVAPQGVTGGETVIIDAPVVVVGDFNANGTIIWTKNTNSVLNVTGCLYINGTVELQIDADDQKDGRRTLAIASCGSNSPPPIKITQQKKSCKKVSATSEIDQTENSLTLNVVFKVDKSKCNIWWIVLASVLGGVVLLLLAFILLVATVRPVRVFFRPFIQRKPNNDS